MMQSIPEIDLARLILGGDSSPLATDGYKFSMGQAGFPLRPESFYLSFRKGGPWVIPFDIGAVIREFLPRSMNAKEAGFLQANGYGMTPAMEQALQGNIQITAAPKGSWVHDREPIATIVGPSFLVSWLEPLVIALNFPIQIATALVNGVKEFEASCADEAAIIEWACQQVRLLWWKDREEVLPEPRVTVDTEGLGMRFRARVAKNVNDVLEVLGPNESLTSGRAFEAGMRAMTCMEQHRMVLETCREHGLLKTTNVKLAYDLYLIPVGTTGHEHQMRWGNDEDAYRAIRDCRPEPPSYLPDTHDADRLGIPAAIKVMREDPSRACSVRLDSGNQMKQLTHLDEETNYERARRYSDGPGGPSVGPRPTYIFADGYNDTKTSLMEEYARGKLGIDAARLMYCYGGFFVSEPLATPYTRNAVSAVYKLSQTGHKPVMKQSEPGKESTPGVPVIRRSADGESLIAQAGETVEGYFSIDQYPGKAAPPKPSPQTQRLIDQCWCAIRPSQPGSDI